MRTGKCLTLSQIKTCGVLLCWKRKSKSEERVVTWRSEEQKGTAKNEGEMAAGERIHMIWYDMMQCCLSGSVSYLLAGKSKLKGGNQ